MVDTTVRFLEKQLNRREVSITFYQFMALAFGMINSSMMPRRGPAEQVQRSGALLRLAKSYVPDNVSDWCARSRCL